jgi:hypothetical protein
MISRPGLTGWRTSNGQNASPAGIDRSELLQLIDAYASSSMPF